MDDHQKDADPLPTEIKQLYRSVYALVKQLDERRNSITNCSQLFTDETQLRRQLMLQVDGLIFQPNVAIGRKSREILWRKCFYDIISLVKRYWGGSSNKNNVSKVSPKDKDFQSAEMVQLINEGILMYKSIVLRMDCYFEMDLGNIFNLSEFEPQNDDPDSTVVQSTNGVTKFPFELMSYAVETVHAALLSLGDLHRYFIDFNLKQQTPEITREKAAQFYYDAFQLNTKVGMAQNQLGTLFAAKRYDLDAMYHYLYSLICPIPFELSENNVARIFAANAEYLKLLVDDSLEVTVRKFLARFKLCVDIFFFDKEVTDFNALCHCMLIDLRTLLLTRRTQLIDDFLFKIIAILMFCLAKLSSSGSQRVHSLNALLVAICSDLVDSALANLEKFIASRSEQNAVFQETYGSLFELFDRNVRLSRKANRMLQDNENECNTNSDVTRPDHRLSKHATRTVLTSESSVECATMKIAGSDLLPADSAKRDSGSVGQPRSDEDRKKTSKLRRRRRRITSDESEEARSADDVSESDLDDYNLYSEFSSDDDNDSSQESSSDEEIEAVVDSPEHLAFDEQEVVLPLANDMADMILEEEHVFYLNGTDASNKNGFHSVDTDGTLGRLLMKFCEASDDDDDDEVECSQRVNKCVLPNGNTTDVLDKDRSVFAATLQPAAPSPVIGQEAIEKLRYKRKYTKIDPNIIIEFAQQEGTLQALKILFDWLKINVDILRHCYASNPEFVHKIMRLMNHLNIDVFTRKVCFERSLIKTTGVRDDLSRLFEMRAAIPLNEDVLLKDFSVLAAGQQQLEFEGRMHLSITRNEEHMMRMFKLIDFGFFLCKSKQFRYNFCARSRMFVDATQREMGHGKTSNAPATGGGGAGRSRNRSNGDNLGHKRGAKMRRRKQNVGRIRMRMTRPLDVHTSNDENDILAFAQHSAKKMLPKKSYLKNRNHQHVNSGSDLDATANADADQPVIKDDQKNIIVSSNAASDKFELMGKLWLRNEVKELEVVVNGKPTAHFTPFLVVDVSALTDHASIVKSLIKTKKFVVLIPSIVLTELDEMKKNREDARNAIRWLEAEFSKGSRFLRLQRSYETLAIPLLKVQRKFDREIFNFLQIAQFCNYMQSSHSDHSSAVGVPQPGVITLLTGGRLTDKKSDTFSYSGIMHAISVHFEPISTFYVNYKIK